MPLPSAGCHFKQKLVFPKLVIQKKNPSASHILRYPQNCVPRGRKGTRGQALCPGAEKEGKVDGKS